MTTADHNMNNTLSNNTSIKCVRDTSVTAVVFPCLYSVLFIAALILNALAAWIFFSIPSTSTFLVFLKNVVRLFVLPLHSKEMTKNIITITKTYSSNNRWWLTCS